MRSNKLSHVFIVTILTVLATSTSLAAEEHPKHHHYKLIDLGTLGGPQSAEAAENQTFTAPATRMINTREMVTGAAELNVPDPYSPFCLISDCMLVHSFLWRDGKMTDLGALPGVNDTFPNWVNDRGEVVGASFNGVDPVSGAPLLEAILWKNGSVIDMGEIPGGNQSIANSINARGEVVGAAVNGTPDPFPNLWPILFFNNTTEIHAVRWRHGTVTDLGTLGGPDSTAIFVNNSGQIVGQSLTDSIVNPSTGQPTQHPFLWQNGTILDLGTLGGTFGIPTGLNNRGQVVGQMTLPGDVANHAFLWDRGTLTDLGTLGGDTSYASWINDNGEILGGAGFPGNQTLHAVIWKNGVMTDLGTPDDDPCSDASVINSRGQAVGISSDCHGTVLHSYLWENGGPIVDLQTLVLPGSDLAVGDNISINDRGEIVANGLLPNGAGTRAILLIPCDDDHHGMEGCDYSLVDANIAAQARTQQAAQSSTVANENDDKPTGLRGRLDGRLIHSRGFSSVRSPNK
jgi:probable HAF family extracellular repeat protein